MKRAQLVSALIAVILVLGIVTGCAAPATPAPAAPAATTAPAASAATSAPAAAAGKKFVIATDASFPPMETVDDQSKQIVGFDPSLLAAIAKSQNIQYSLQNTAWDGIFAGLEAGQYDAVLSSVTVTDDRKQKYDFSDPYFDANQGIVVRADDTTIKSGDDLKGKTVGAQIETTGAIAVRKIEGANLKQYDTPDLAMQDLVNKNLDAVVVDYPVAANFALQSPQFKDKLKISGQLVTNEVYALCVKKGDPQKLLPLFNAGLKAVKASGEYDTIYKQWVGNAPSK